MQRRHSLCSVRVWAEWREDDGLSNLTSHPRTIARSNVLMIQLRALGCGAVRIEIPSAEKDALVKRMRSQNI